MTLVHHFLEKSAALIPDNIALVCEDRRLTYAQLNSMADRLAAALIAMGMKKQDRVVVLLENSVESVVSVYAVLKAGGIFVMLNPGIKGAKLNFILKDSGARVVITDGSKAQMIAEATVDAIEVKHCIWCGKFPGLVQTAIHIKDSVSWDSVMAEPDSPVPRPSIIDVDLAAITYTSGSTGEPKGVVSAHRNMVSVAQSICTYLGNSDNDIILNTLPLSFGYGLYQVFMAPLFRGKIVLEKGFVFPHRVMERLVRERATGFPLVPTMAAIMLQMENLQQFDFSSLRYITNAAAALPVSYIQRLQAILPNVSIYSMYGQTECARACYLPPEELLRRPSSVGIPIPNEELFVVDAAGNEVAPGEVGELVVRGSNVMQGYWNRPEETAKTFRRGCYRDETVLYTGDLFRRDEEGFLYFVARKDDLIKTKGEVVSPKEIENTLSSMPGIAEVAVIGIPDEILGQAIKAYVVPERETVLSAEQVMKYCSKLLEPFMIPKYVEFRASLPKSPSGKIDKLSLKGAEPASKNLSSEGEASRVPQARSDSPTGYSPVVPI